MTKADSILILDDPLPSPTDSETHRELVRVLNSRKWRKWLRRQGFRKHSYTNRYGNRVTIMSRR